MDFLDGWKVNCWMDGWKDGLLDGWIVGWKDGLVDMKCGIIGGESLDEERAELKGPAAIRKMS